MANKRMFSKTIVDTDAFLDMPMTSQLLYFHLAMRADDEGFVGSPKKIMRMCGFQDDDLKVLITKRFILTFNSGVVVIKHWLIHNTIRMDRFQPTSYQDEKKQLKTQENKAYSELGKPNGNQLATQVKLSKVKLSKVKNATIVADSKKEKRKDTYMELKEFIKWCSKSNQRHIFLIGEYADTIKPAFSTRGQWEVFIKRNLRPAKDLSVFTDEQISNAMSRIQKAQGDGWLKKYTLETLIKFLN